MKKNEKAYPLFLLLTASGFCGFTIAASNHAASNQTGGNAAQAPVAVSDKAAKKISMAIGEEVENFVVTAQEEVEAPAGFKGMQYTVMTSGGKKFKCEVLESSKLGRVVTWGKGAGADAACTEFASSGKGKASAVDRKPAGTKPPAVSGGAPAKATPIAVSDKAAKKISKAIGEEVEDFVVTAQEEIEAPAGFKGMQYTVMTDGGKKFKCEVLESSKLGRVVTWGKGAGADAMCTDFTAGSKDKGKTNSANCNALLRAAGKCS